jgi:hypothetical protein
MRSTAKKWKKINVQAIPIAGVFEAEGLPTMNFMNGFEHQGTFFTNAASEEIFEEEFVDQIKKFCPNLNVMFVPKEDQKGLMEFYLTHANGGLNCMSWKYEPVAPLSFPTNRALEKEIEPWEVPKLGNVSDLVFEYVGNPEMSYAQAEKSKPAGNTSPDSPSHKAGITPVLFA